MNVYNVTIKGTVIKTILVEAKDRCDAVQIAHSLFTTECAGDEEKYEEDTLFVELTEGVEPDGP